MMRKALTYDDIQLVPEMSFIKHRSDINLNTRITTNYSLKVPFVASPMDTICGEQMAFEFAKFGGVGCIHRFMSIEEQTKSVSSLINHIHFATVPIAYDNMPIMAAIGTNGDYLERAQELLHNGANILLIDVAHGHHENVKLAIEALRKLDGTFDIIAGNIATSRAALDLEAWGANGLRVGIGGGSLCTTRKKTGFGIPNVTCLEDVINAASVPVMADGGIRFAGDIAKALALGASSVMLGSLIAGTDESPGDIIKKDSGLYKRYRGSASLETKIAHGQSSHNVEGESTVIPYKGQVSYILKELIDDVKSALSYGGASTLEMFHPQIVEVTNAGIREANPHLLL